MNKCPRCKHPLQFPALFVGYNELKVPISEFICPCGNRIRLLIDSMAPYTAERDESFPPSRGNYCITPDGEANFTCPICKGLFGVRGPTHSINDEGIVRPSVVCPYKCGFHAWMTLKDYKGKQKPEPTPEPGDGENVTEGN